MSDKYYGKHRGTVANNVDPLRIGRIQVTVPSVLGMSISTWAMPSFPLAGLQNGAMFVPIVGSGIWVEFENGDPDFPIWTGCWFGSAAEVPSFFNAGSLPSPSIVLQTSGQNSLVISDLPGPTGGILIKSATGAMIQVNDLGITISNGKGATIVMTGPTVDINSGALTVI